MKKKKNRYAKENILIFMKGKKKKNFWFFLAQIRESHFISPPTRQGLPLGPQLLEN